MNNEVTFLFGRFHLIANYKDKKTYIRNSFKTNTKVMIRGFEWSIFDVTEISYCSEEFIFGNLAKYKPKCDEEVVDSDQHILTKTPMSNKVIAKSPFVLHIQSGIIAYHPIVNKISENQFRVNFSRFIEQANEYLLITASIETINEETAILDAIHIFNKINYISIELYPSNPNNRDRWRNTDERLKKMNAEKFQEFYESKDGLKISDADDVYGDLIMAADGYGKATLSGIINEKKKTVSTEEMSIEEIVPKDDNPKNLVASLFSKFQNIRWRMKK